MKLLLTAALLFTASAGIAFAEGRYETTSIENMKMDCTPVKKADD